MNKIAFILLFTLFFSGHYLEAREPYRAEITVDAASETVNAPNLVDLNRELKTTSLEALIPIYTPASPVSIDFNFRGILMSSSFAADSTTLVVQIPQAGITESFTGATRDQSLTLFKDFVRDGGPHHKLLRAYAKYSPIDPIAGNPNSLMAQMGQADYLLGRLSPLSGCDCFWNSQPIVHQFQGGVNAGRAFSGGFDTTSVNLPLRYSYSPCADWALIIDAPLTYIRNGGASSVFGSLGFGFRFPVTHEWSLTTTSRLGFGGSLDLCTSGTFFSTGVASTYNYKLSSYVLSMTNYAGYFTSTNFWLTGVNFNYNLHNFIIKNGLSLNSCSGFTLCKREINFNVSIIDSYFTRNQLYIRHYDEVGFSFFTRLNPFLDYDCLSLGFSYQFGEKNYKGYFINTNYQF